jgi:hypothetical protein
VWIAASNIKLSPSTTLLKCLLGLLLLLTRRPRDELIPELVDGHDEETREGLVRGLIGQGGVGAGRYELLSLAEVLSCGDGALLAEDLMCGQY